MYLGDFSQSEYLTLAFIFRANNSQCLLRLCEIAGVVAHIFNANTWEAGAGRYLSMSLRTALSRVSSSTARAVPHRNSISKQRG